MEVATLVATLRAEISGFQRNLATADSAIAGTRAQLKQLEGAAAEASAALKQVELSSTQATATRANLDLIAGGLEKVRNAALEAKAAMAGLGASGGAAAVGGVMGGGEAPRFRGTMQYGLLGMLLGESEARRLTQIIRTGTMTGESRGGIEGVFLGIPQTQYLAQTMASQPVGGERGPVGLAFTAAPGSVSTGSLRETDAQVQALDQCLRDAYRDAELLKRCLESLDVSPTLAANVEADAAAMTDLRDQALEAAAAVELVSSYTPRTLIAAAATGGTVGEAQRVFAGGPAEQGLVPYTAANLLLQNRVLSLPEEIAKYGQMREPTVEVNAKSLDVAGAGLDAAALGLQSSAELLGAAAVAGGARGGGGGGAAAAGGFFGGLGFGGGRGIWLPPPFGWGFRGRRVFGGAAALGSLGGLMGFGAERALASTAGIAGSLGGGLLGGGLLAGGVLGTTAVGMGTDMAGIGQAAGDIKTVSTDLGALQTAIRVYGRNSTQAAQAQAQLNQDLGGFSPVAKNAVLAASQTSQAFKSMFDQVTGLAERTGAEIINQAMQTGMKFLPTIGKFAFQNMQIIQHGLQPFFAWLQNTGKQGGLGIFTNLEQIFQARLPTMIHALTQGAELFAKIIDVAAQQTGGLAQHLNDFLTKWNAASNFGRVSEEVRNLIGLFRTWAGLLGSIIHLVFALFQPAVGLGKQFAQSLTDIVNQVRAWVQATGTQNVLHSLFAAHAEQVKLLGQLIQSLLPLLLNVVSAFLQIEAAFASAFNNGLKPIIDAIKWLLSNPLVDKFLGWAGAIWLVVRATAALQAAFALLFSGEVLAGLKSIPLAFLGIQSAAIKAQVATDAETTSIAEMDAVAAGGGAAAAAGGGGLLTGLRGGIGRAGLFAGGGFLLGGLARQMIPGRTGGIAQGAITGAGIGAGLGSIIPGLGTGVGAGIGAVAGALLSLGHAMPSLNAQITRLAAAFALLKTNTRASATVQQMLADKLQQVGQQARASQALIVSGGRAMYVNKTLTDSSAQALARWTAAMEQLASSSNPKLRAVAQQLIAIREATNRIPSHKTITITIRQVAAGVQFGGGPYGIGIEPSGKPGLNLNLPRSIQMQLAAAQAGHGSIAKADAAAYAYYEALLKRHNLTRKQILAIYQAEAQYAPYQTPHSYQHATGSVTGATTGMAMLPTSVQNALQRAQQRAARADVTSPGQMTPAQLQRALAANRALHSEQQQAIQDLIRKASQVNAASAQHAALEREITALTRQQAATQRQITADLKQQHALQVQGRINKILGIGGGGQALSQTGGIQQRERNMFIKALEQVLGGSKHTLAATAAALGVTPGQLARESPAELLRQMRQHGITLDAKSMAELRKIQQAIQIAHKENVRLTPAETRKITNWLQQIQQELTGTSTMKSNYIAPSAVALTAGLGLTKAQQLAEIGRLSSYYMHGHKVPTGGAAGGIPLPSGVGGGVQLPATHHHHHHHHRHPGTSTVFSSGSVVINVTAAGKDGAALAREIRAELLRIQRRNGAQTRGPAAGKGVGLA